MSVKLHHRLAAEFSSCVAVIRVPERNNVMRERFYFSCDYTEFKSIVAGKMGMELEDGGKGGGGGCRGSVPDGKSTWQRPPTSR